VPLPAAEAVAPGHHVVSEGSEQSSHQRTTHMNRSCHFWNIISANS
jgi:hypothetical protein